MSLSTVSQTSEFRAARVFTLYRVVSRLYFYLPVLLVFFLSRHMNYLEIGVLLAAYSVVVGAMEGISLRVASRFTLRHTLAVAEIVKAIGLFLLFMSETFTQMLLAQIVCGTGYVLALGIDSALLSRSVNSKELYATTETRSHGLVLTSIMLSGVVGGAIAQFFGVEVALLLSIPCALAAGGLALYFEEPEKSHGAETPAKRGDLLLYLKTRPELIRHVMNYALIRGIFMALFVAVFPVVYFVNLKTPLALFGVVLGGYTFVSVMASKHHQRIKAMLGERNLDASAYASLLGVVVLLNTQEIAQGFVYLAPVLLGYSAGITRPKAVVAFHAACSEAYRAKVVALAEWGCALVTALLIAGSGACMHFYGIQNGLMSLMWVVIVIVTVSTGYMWRAAMPAS